MQINVGTIDRGVRIIAGLTLTGLALTGVLGAWAYLGIVPLATGLLGTCPAYSLVGMNTCSLRKT